MAKVSLIEHLHDNVYNNELVPPDYNLASSDTLIYDGNVPQEHFCRNMSVDSEASNDYLRSYGAPDHTLGRMALYLYDGSNDRTQAIPISEDAKGWIGSSLLFIDADAKTVHYPVIGFDLSRHKTLNHLNATFMHELRHAADSYKTPLYGTDSAVNSIRLALGGVSAIMAQEVINTAMMLPIL